MKQKQSEKRKAIIEKVKARQEIFNRARAGDVEALIYLGKLYLGQK